MVLGLFEGKVDLTTDKKTYLPGETIKGQVTLTLNKPKKATELRVMFFGEYTQQIGRNTITRRIYEVKLNLDSDREYPSGSKIYDFQIQIPQIKRAVTTGEGILGGIQTVVTNFTDPVLSCAWYVEASLNLPLEFDINKSVRINLQV
jgi:hypothetical protein